MIPFIITTKSVMYLRMDLWPPCQGRSYSPSFFTLKTGIHLGGQYPHIKILDVPASFATRAGHVMKVTCSKQQAEFPWEAIPQQKRR